MQKAARCIAILEAIDRDLDQRGPRRHDGAPLYLLNHGSRTSRQLEQWLEKVSAAIEKAEHDVPDATDDGEGRHPGDKQNLAPPVLTRCPERESEDACQGGRGAPQSMKAMTPAPSTVARSGILSSVRSHQIVAEAKSRQDRFRGPFAVVDGAETARAGARANPTARQQRKSSFAPGGRSSSNASAFCHG